MAIDPTFEPYLRTVAPLTEYAWQYRYPGEPFDPEEPDVRRALDKARTVVALVIERLPADTHP